jgi:hypothetical protein
MIRRFALVSALTLGVSAACAGPATNMTSTTGGTVNANTAQCAGRHSSCVTDNDCCSLWCVDGSCARREP